MKWKLLLLMFWLFCSATFSQTVVTNDPSFEAYLETLPEAQGQGNTANDNEVFFSDLSTITSITPALSGISTITDLTGLERFFNLEQLQIQNNPITTLTNVEGLTRLLTLRAFNGNVQGSVDLSLLVDLEIIGLDNNQITTLTLPTSTNLRVLDIRNSSLDILDLTNKPNITQLAISGNQLTILDISGIDNLQQFRTCDNTGLNCIQVSQIQLDNLAATTSALNCPANGAPNDNVGGWLYDNTITQFSTTADCRYTIIPDDAFEQYLIDEGIDTEGILDDRVLTDDIADEQSLDLSGISGSGIGITDLTGIEDFNALQTLLLQGNSVATLDLTNNAQLVTLDVFFNDMTILNVAGLSQLDFIAADGNDFSILDFSSNTNLTYLSVDQNNNLTQMDLRNNTRLDTVFLKENNAMQQVFLPIATSMTFLDIRNNPSLTSLDISTVQNLTNFFACGNTSLNCITVADVTAANNQPSGACPASAFIGLGWYKDSTTIYSTDCSGTYTLVPDDAFEQALIDQGIDSEGILDDRVLTSDIESETVLNLTGVPQAPLNFTQQDQGLGIEDMTGIEDFRDLQTLLVQGNQNTFTELDLSNNFNLEVVYGFFNSNLNLLNVNGLVNLQTVGVNFCGITDADFSTNSSLNSLDITDNGLQTIDFGTIGVLEALTLSNNQLETLDIAAFDANLNDFQSQNNPLTCIRVSNEQQAIDRVGSGVYQIPNGDTSIFTLQDCTSVPFEVTASLGGDVVDVSALPCCPDYEIDEGQLLQLVLDAEVTAIDGQQYVISLSSAGSVADTNDFTVRNASANDEYSFTVVTATVDGTIDIDIVLDGVAEGDENLRLTLLPIGTNFTLADPTVFDIRIKDVTTQPFEVNATIGGQIVDISNQPCCPDYEIEEGQLLEISFESDISATLGEEYIVEVLYDGSTTDAQDISVREFSANSQYTYSVKAGDPDNILQIDMVNDGVTEPDEILQITLRPVGANFTIVDPTVFTIRLKDATPTTIATIVATDSDASEDPLDNGEFTVSLGQINTTGSPITINYMVSGDATPIDDYQVLSGTVDILDGTDSTLIPIIPENDIVVENIETVTITLNTGTGYTIGTPDNATVNITSEDVESNEGPNLDSDDIAIVVLSNSCPGVANGSISVTTQRDLNFSITVDESAAGTLSNNTNFLRENLAAGTYDVCLTLAAFPDWKRCFKVVVEGLNEINLVGIEVDESSKVASIEVFGSKNYVVNVNGQLYDFHDSNGATSTTNIQIPLEKGLNNILISGELQCQGIVGQKLFLGDLRAYPNPVVDNLQIVGIDSDEEANLIITNLAGKVIYNKRNKSINGKVDIDFSAMESGVYLIFYESAVMDKQFKILKR